MSHRRHYLIQLFVLGYGVIDPLLDIQDMLLIAQVAGSFSCNLNTSRSR